jgi:hypothetical protein
MQLGPESFLLLLLWLVLLILLALLILLLLLLLISRPRKGGISIIFPMSQLTCALLLHRISGALLLTLGSTVTPTTTGRACSLPGRHSCYRHSCQPGRHSSELSLAF